MREKPYNAAGILGWFDMARAARALALIAKTAWYLAFVAAAIVILLGLLWFWPLQDTNAPAVRRVFDIIIFCLGNLFFIPVSPVPIWIALAFIWFFAAWFSKVAEKRARAETPAPDK